MVKNIILLLLLAIGISSSAQVVLTTQISKGNKPGNDYIQMVVVGKRSCTEAGGKHETVDISHFIVYDSNLDSFPSINGENVFGIASGKYWFPNTFNWANVPYGTQILIYNDLNKNSDIVVNDNFSYAKSNNFWVLPISALERADTSTAPPAGYIIPSPPALNLKDNYYALLNKAINVNNPVTSVSDWIVDKAKGNESPANNSTSVNGSIGGMQTNPDVRTFAFSLERNPGDPSPTGYDTTNGVITPVYAGSCPHNITITRNGPFLPDSLLQLVNYTWTYYNHSPSSVEDATPADLTTIKKLFNYKDSLVVIAKLNRVCLTQNTYLQAYVRPGVIQVPNPLSVFITSDSLATPVFDSLASTFTDSIGVQHYDSTKTYIGICKGSSTRLTAIINQQGPPYTHSWQTLNGDILSYDTSYIYTSTHTGKDTLLYTINSNIKCLVNNIVTDTVVITGLDSIAIPRITIIGDTSVCSGIKDTFTAVLSPSPLADTTAKYKIVWFVNNAGTNSSSVYEDPTIYTDTSTAPKIYVDENANPGDQISAILLVAKNNSCAYYDSTLSYSLITPDNIPYQPLHDTSNTLTLGVTQTITPTINLKASQNYLCPDTILQRLGVKDTIVFTAVADTISAKTAVYTWTINGVPVTDIGSITVNATNDTTTFTSNGILKDGDVVEVIMVTSFKCVTSDSATAFLPMKEGIPVLSAVLAAGPFCSAGLQNDVTLTPTNVQNEGSKPKYSWTLNNKFVTDSSAYVYNPIVDKDTVTLKITSSIVCAIPKDTTLVLPITVTAALTPSVSISAPILTTCSNDPNNPNNNPLTINAFPVNGGTNPSYACYLVGDNGAGSDIFLANDTIIYPINTGTTPQIQRVYCTLTSSESCVTQRTVTSTDTISITVNPLPVVDPILGNGSVCVGAQTTLTETTTGGQWNSLSSFNATIDASGIVTGVNPGNARIIYLKIDPVTGCSKTQNFTITVNPSDVPNDVLLYKTICAGQFDTIYNSIVPQGTFISSDPNIATVAPGFDANGVPCAIVTAVGNGRVIITDSIVNDCGTTLRYDTIFVGAPIVQPIQQAQNKNTLCNNTDVLLLTDATDISGPDWTAIWTSGGNTILSDTVYGNPSTVNVKENTTQGNDNITYSITNACGTNSASYGITIGLPFTPSISPDPAIVCTGYNLTLNGSASGGKWSSANADIATVDATTGNVSGLKTGTATINYTDTNACGSSSITSTVNVNSGPTPQPITGSDSVICNLATLQLSCPASGVSFSWYSDKTDLATVDQNGLVTAQKNPANGVATIGYITNGTCGTDTVFYQVIIGAPIVQQLIAKSPICVNDTITLTSVTRGATLGTIWNSLNENYLHIIDNQTGQAVGVSGGVANIQYIASNACGVNLAKTTLTVNALPVVPAIVGSQKLCVKDTLTYTDIASDGVWGSSNTATASISSTGFVTALASGTTTLTYAVTSPATSCKNAVTESVTVNPLPTVSPITGAATVCSGRSITLANATTTSTSTWSSNNTAIATVTSTGAVLGLQPGSTSIKYLVIDANSCRDSVSAPITVNAIPSIAPIVGLSTLCTGKSFTFTDATSGGNWATTTGNATVTSGGIVTSVTQGKDTITYTVVAGGCDTTVKSPLGLTTPNVAPIIAAKVEVPVGLTIDLTNASLPGVWSSIDPSIASVVGISDGLGRVTGVAPGKDSIQYTYTDPTGCEAPAYIVVTVLSQLNDVYIPNAFSPTSSDAANRNFMVLGKNIASLDFKVFSPWGELLYQTSDKNAGGWDGTKNGKFIPSGVYVYTAKITLLDGKTISRKGSVNLIR